MSFCSLRIRNGSAFQSLGAATEKALSPNVVNILPEDGLRMTYCWLVDLAELLSFAAPNGDEELVSHLSQHVKAWGFWFKKMGKLSNCISATSFHNLLRKL